MHFLEWNHFGSLQWRHNGCDCISNHQSRDYLRNRLFRLTGNSPGPVNSPHKWPVTRKMFPFDDVIMSIQIILKFFSWGPNWWIICIGSGNGLVMNGQKAITWISWTSNKPLSEPMMTQYTEAYMYASADHNVLTTICHYNYVNITTIIQALFFIGLVRGFPCC